MEFELPEGWACSQPSHFFYCQKKGKNPDVSYIVISKEEKEAGKDEISFYLERTVKRLSEASSVKIGRSKIEPIYRTKIEISGREWIDSLYDQIERPGFNTRILMTFEKSKVVSFHINYRRESKTDFSKFFEPSVKSLRAFSSASHCPVEEDSRVVKIEKEVEREFSKLLGADNAKVGRNIVIEGSKDLPGGFREVELMIDGHYSYLFHQGRLIGKHRWYSISPSKRLLLYRSGETNEFSLFDTSIGKSRGLGFKSTNGVQKVEWKSKEKSVHLKLDDGTEKTLSLDSTK